MNKVVPLAALGLAFAAPASAQSGAVPLGVAAPPIPAELATPAAPEPLTPEQAAEDLLAIGTAETRMTVPVSIGQRGPWGFVIDTGAERTVVSRQLATVLGLQSGPGLRVTAMTGTVPASSVIVPGLSVSSLAAKTITAPALEGRDIGAAGLLGIDALQGHAIAIDFDHEEMALRPSRKRRVAEGTHGDEVVVVAKSLYGQLIVTNARWQGKQIAVIIDTGSAATLGNPALLAMMQGHARSLGESSLISVTGARLETQAYLARDVEIGQVAIGFMPIAFADAAPFHRFGLEKRPALMLGMDTLRLFRRVRIDFANRDIQFTLPRSAVGGTSVRFGA